MIFDFNEIESEYKVQLHSSVKRYFNSYWFLELTGWFSSYHINLHPVVPGIKPGHFISLLKDYIESKNDIFKYIPIGFESNGMLIVLDNSTGEGISGVSEVKTFVGKGQQFIYTTPSAMLQM